MSDPNSWRNPLQDNTTQRTEFHSAYYAQKTSALAILSLVAGILSFPLMCLCFTSIPFSVFAIVSGHMSRGIVRDSNGQYGGAGMATAGMSMGYTSLCIMGGMLLIGMLSSTPSPPRTAVQNSSNSSSTVTLGEALLQQAEGQLLSQTGQEALGISTCEKDAAALSRHYIETLHVLDSTHFAETNQQVTGKQRNYRVFVQLNQNSAAFLVLVPELNRFTPAARKILDQRCWLIAQRSLDEVLPEGCDLAVAIYSTAGVEQIMAGISKPNKNEAADSGPAEPNADRLKLSSLFRVTKIQPSAPRTTESSFDSQIDNKTEDGNLKLPAEIE